MLDDVETTHSLSVKLSHLDQISDLQHALQVTQAELDERRAYDAVKTQELHTVGDVFVGELFVLSKKLYSLEQKAEENRMKLENFDCIKQKLERSEELVRTLQRTMSLNREAYGLSSPGREIVEGVASKHATARYEEEGTEVPTSAAKVVVEEETTPKEGASTVEENIGQEGPNLETLDETLLLNIFSYLDAIDVVHTAIVNVSFYSRVDSLFGLSGSSANLTATNGAGGGKPETEVVEKTTVVVPPVAPAAPPTATIATIPSTKGAPPPPLPSIPSLVVKPIPAESAATRSHVRSASTTSVPSTTLTAAASSSTPVQQPRNALANVFSILGQPKTPQAGKKTPALGNVAAPGGAATSSAGASDVSSSTASVTTSDATKFSASMASSMAEKLTQAEVAVIIRMTEQIRAKDKEISKIKAEREDLAARLEGTEAVKEFLISKIRDTERSLKKCQDDAAKTMQQTSSDQEVISFLDYRVKELERLYKDTKEKLAAEQEQYKVYTEKAEKRQTVLEDMLQFERQQLADSELEWKATKKVLVKEVKHCRAQLLALQAERDGFRHKNMQLKHALLTMNGGSGSSGGPKT